MNLSLGSNNNQITNSGFQYDAAGNMTNDGRYSYAYNAEDEITSADGVNYTYDASNERDAKTSSSSATNYVHDPSGDVLSEADASGTDVRDYIFFDGRRIAETVGEQQPNPGFEQGWTGWENGCGGSPPQLVTNDHSGAHFGNAYIEISGNGCFHSTYLLPVVPGEVVTFGGWAYRSSGSTGSVGWHLMALDANQNPVGYPSPGPSNVTAATWTYQEGTYTIPSGVAYVRLYGQVYQSTDNASGKFDDGSLTLRGVPQYLFSDVIGSTRVVTNATGTPCFDADYYPYGQEVDYNTSCAPEFRFAGMEYDSETGNYYDHARYYNPRLGRFMSPDPSNAGADPSNPQSWNAYAYVQNNPVTLTDPDGRDVYACLEGRKGSCLDYADEESLKLALYGTGAQLEGGQIVVNTNGKNLVAGTYYTEGGPFNANAGAAQDASMGLFNLATGVSGLAEGAFRGAVSLIEGEAESTAEKAAAEAGTEGLSEQETAASTPVGRRGSPLEVAPGTNTDQVVGGIGYSGHALDEMQSEGVMPSVVRGAIENGSRAPGYGDRVVHLGDGVKVITDRAGRVVTVMLQRR